MKLQPSDLTPEELDQILMWGAEGLEIEVEGEPLSQEEKQKFYDECCALAPKELFIRFDDWHLLRDHYVIFGDLEDTEALDANFSFFEVNPWWLCTIERESYSLEGHDPLGLIFLRAPKWRREEVRKALMNYANRMEWKHKGFKDLGRAVMAELRVANKASF